MIPKFRNSPEDVAHRKQVLGDISHIILRKPCTFEVERFSKTKRESFEFRALHRQRLNFCPTLISLEKIVHKFMGVKKIH